MRVPCDRQRRTREVQSAREVVYDTRKARAVCLDAADGRR